MASHTASNFDASSLASPAKPKRGRPPKNQSPVLHGGIRKAFPCEYCPRSFGRKSDMARHTHVHTGTRPHRCTFPACGKEFIQTSALTVHTRVHTGEKPHCCPEDGCDKRFSDSSSLARHRKIHRKPFQCGFGICSKGHMSWDKLHDHVTKIHKAVQVHNQNYVSLLRCPDIFKYRKTVDDRIFAIPLRVVSLDTGVPGLIANMDNCQEQNIQPGDWVYKDFPVPATGVAAKVSAPVSDSYPVQHRREYQGLDSYRLISASENTLSPTMEWQANATVPDASMPMPFQGPVSQATQEQAALMPALNFASAQHNSLLSYGRVTPHTGMAVYPGTSNHGMVSAPGVTPVPGNVSVSESVAAPHGLPIQQGFSINGSMPVPYAQGLTGQFGPALVQQGDNSVGFSDQRRVSSSTENTSYSDQIGYNNGEMQDLSERQAYGGQYQMYGNGVQPYREGFGSFGDASGLSGDGSQSPLPDMTCSDPPSPAEIEDNLPVYFEDFGIKEDDANGIPLPNQYFNNMA